MSHVLSTFLRMSLWDKIIYKRLLSYTNCKIHDFVYIPDVAVVSMKSRFTVRTCSDTREDSLMIITGPGWKTPTSSTTLYAL